MVHNKEVLLLSAKDDGKDDPSLLFHNGMRLEMLSENVRTMWNEIKLPDEHKIREELEAGSSLARI